MLIKTQIRQLIPLAIKNNTKTLSEEIETWLKTQHIQAHVSVAYGVDGHSIEFPREQDKTLFLLKYSEFVI